VHTVEVGSDMLQTRYLTLVTDVQVHLLEDVKVTESDKYHAAITIQKTVRMFLKYRQYKKHVHARNAAAAQRIKVNAMRITPPVSLLEYIKLV
jgi:uncharacterized protein (DUF2461 family)